MISTKWSQTTKRLVVVGLVIILLLVLFVFRALLPPVAIAVVLAYILKPFADFVERRAKLPRTLAVILVFVILLLLLATIPVTVVPYTVDQVTRLNLNLQRLTEDLITFLSPSPLSFWTIRSTWKISSEIWGQPSKICSSLLPPGPSACLSTSHPACYGRCLFLSSRSTW